MVTGQSSKELFHMHSGASRVAGKCSSIVHQYLHLQEEFHLSSAPPAYAFILANQFPSHSSLWTLFKLLLFFFNWVLGASESVHEPCRKGIPVSCVILGPWTSALLAF